MSQILARKVPWSSPTEFITVFELLFSSSDPIHTQSIALNHISAWAIRSPSSLPPAIESTHAILSLLLPPNPSAQQQSLGLAMALTRFVNSLVDPLQTGMYARSISQIASELGLPLAFVQLRHRATHEDLPSNAVLLESANLALDWLYTHFWLPRLNDIEGMGQFKQETITSLENLLISFKQARKQAITDVTQSAFLKILPQINTWVSSAVRELRGDGSQSRHNEEETECELRPLASICSIMCERQLLVPKSHKKRCQSPNDPLPESLKNLYEPLIDHLAQSYPQSFLRTLISTFVSTLSEASGDPNDNKQTHPTYYHTCVAWLVHLLLGPDVDTLGQKALRSLLIKPNQYTLLVVEKLKQANIQSDWFVEQEVLRLTQVLDQVHPNVKCYQGFPETEGMEAKVEEMKRRWEKLMAEGDVILMDEGSAWQLVPEADWSPCPIGCLPNGILPELYYSLV